MKRRANLNPFYSKLTLSAFCFELRDLGTGASAARDLFHKLKEQSYRSVKWRPGNEGVLAPQFPGVRKKWQKQFDSELAIYLKLTWREIKSWPFRLVLDQKQCSVLSLKKIDSILSSKVQCSFWAALSIEQQKLSAESWEIETALNRGILNPWYFGMLRRGQRSPRDEHCNCQVRWNLRRREWRHSNKDSPRSSGGYCLVAGTDTRPLGDQVSRSTSGLCSLSVPAIYTEKKSFNQSINQSIRLCGFLPWIFD